MEIQKDRLNKMAGYLDKGPEGLFCMRQYHCCVIGHVARALGIEGHAEWSAAYTVFGLDGQAAAFCFGSQWSNCPKAAAERLRYVAQHGDAPSNDQWERFEVAPEVAKVEGPELLEEAFA